MPVDGLADPWEFRRVPNLFEIVSYAYWEKNYDYQMPGPARERMERYLGRRRRSQPIGKASCGSVFRNPPDKSVGAMIDDCGLKGFSVGGAEVSPVHANFIVNNGSATAKDVLSVIQHVHARVKETYGVELQPEVKFLGF